MGPETGQEYGHGPRRPRELVVFLDFDGTLAPIVDRPDDACISDSVRDVLRQLSKRYTTAIVSGRKREDVEQRVRIPDIFFAGSHGLDISVPDALAAPGSGGTAARTGMVAPSFERYKGDIAEAVRHMESALGSIPGCVIENNKFTASVHDRMVADDRDRQRIEDTVREYVVQHAEVLRLTAGKRVWELRPNVNWDKGRAVIALLEYFRRHVSRVHVDDLSAPLELFCLYLGDDQTDEAAFEAVRQSRCGFGILVSEVERDTAAHFRLPSTDRVEDFLRKLAWDPALIDLAETLATAESTRFGEPLVAGAAAADTAQMPDKERS